jgi:hypothetical protein
MWLDETHQELFALRWDTRNAYSTLANPLLASDTTDTAPDTAPASSLSFDPQTGLTLAPLAGVFVTDRTYRDVAIDLDAPTRQPAFVELRDNAGNLVDVGSSACPGAIPLQGQPAPSSVHVERHGSQVSWSVPGTAAGGASASGTCTLPGAGADGARVSVGVRGTAAGSVAQNLVVERLSSP